MKLFKKRNSDEMSFFEHLEELRGRLWKIILAVIIFSAVSFYFSNFLLEFLLEPLFYARQLARLPNPRSISYTNPVNPFWVMIEISMLGGFFLSVPVILWELWGFISPGLYSKEKKYAIPFVMSSTALFVGGAIFSYKFVFPIAFQYFVNFSSSIAHQTGMTVQDLTTVDEFISLALKLLVAFGIVFELPILIAFLTLAGIVNYKQLFNFSRYFIVIASIIAAVLTPPDVLSQILMMIPLIVLYFISIGVSYFLGKKNKPK